MKEISIHALLAESDRNGLGGHFSILNFYPRSPCGERHTIQESATPVLEFLSTLSLRRATQGDMVTITGKAISIHALLAESDTAISARVILQKKFLSTLSLRRATPPRTSIRTRSSHFYPRSPCGERPKPDSADRLV